MVKNLLAFDIFFLMIHNIYMCVCVCVCVCVCNIYVYTCLRIKSVVFYAIVRNLKLIRNYTNEYTTIFNK